MAVRNAGSVAEGVDLPEGARVLGAARITSADQVLVMGPSRHDGVTMCTAHRDSQIGVRITRGCFTGTLEGFEKVARRYAKDRPDQLEQALEYIEQARAYFAEGDGNG